MKYISFFCLLISLNLKAQEIKNEPSYCAPAKFMSLEIQSPISASDQKNLLRLRAFKLGPTVLAGMAVGDSKTPTTQKFAKSMSSYNVDQDKYCTWYFAHSNKSALASFISHEIPDPFSIKVENSARIFMGAMQSSFFGDGHLNFLNCAQDHHYIGMGCTEQRHRGPTVFGMLLAFSGCTPEHAAEIVNTAWGLNGLKAEVRLAAIKAAYEYGSQNPNERRRLVDLLIQ